ncbi:ABC transporter permease [Planctomycetota bacterium]
MTIGKLILQNLRYYWRTHLGVILGAALGTAILTGALLVGDSVSYSLNRQALARLGDTQLALVGQDRFFRAELAEELAGKLQVTVAPVLQLNGLLINSDAQTTARSNQVQVLGVDQRFWELAGPEPITIDNDQVILNEPLATQLQVKAGDQVRLRVAKPELLSRDAPLSLDRDMSIERRLTVKAIVTEDQFGRFGLQADQVMPMNAWVPLNWLAQAYFINEICKHLLSGGIGF